MLQLCLANTARFLFQILRKLEVELPDSEDPKHGVRIGWSAETSGLQLGKYKPMLMPQH